MNSLANNGKLYLSLKKLNFPKEWSYPVNPNTSYIIDTFKEAVKCGIFLESNKKHFEYSYSILTVIGWFFPRYNYEQLMIASSVMQWIFVLDDFLERDHIDDEKQQYCVNKCEDILIQGRKSEYISNIADADLAPLDKYTLLLRDRLSKSTKDRVETFNIFIHYLREWFFSVIPLKKSKGESKSDSVHYDVYTFIRTVNVGLYFVIAINNVAVDLKIDGSFWMNPIWSRMTRNASRLFTIVNDCVSYAKEIDQECAGENCLYILQIKSNLPLQTVYNHLVDEFDQIVAKVQKDEILLLESFNYLPNEKIDGIKYLILSLKELLVGNYKWSLVSPRYIHKDSPFIETSRSDSSTIPYETILTPDIFWI
ncbi:hypothetical protein DICPUDRAFT_42082 [Dictyostelium purpureum]|uniref:Terpene synthase 4 n=1 Tax=Dictyostelium purpureum TaxID=5786 RepID=TPS4_DICPU|nr:uncharacterized protein DICPUDRAFT_42082 [Dictyostelium purpureum]F1A1D4.1 RecName: Full=Terpene synthase 4 [Dictyostelium purpureum]AXN72973.1 terpene synthase [Dictyostelium purpureum]EGC29992.1 hypothetical protein DICPUDRAFT_42082 [Dictyostelium purpureum]|eukprot:XP_003293476.1 hypothetical protein DICPUDRAFT_42082 [Dictyostelium purpureum]